MRGRRSLGKPTQDDSYVDDRLVFGPRRTRVVPNSPRIPTDASDCASSSDREDKDATSSIGGGEVVVSVKQGVLTTAVSSSQTDREEIDGIDDNNCFSLDNVDVKKYVRNCHQFDVKIDTNVVIALQTHWQILQPSKRFGEGALLPLMNVLDHNKDIKRLSFTSASMHDSRFRSSGNGNSNARALAFILRKNEAIEDIDLSFTGLDDDGLNEICDGVENNNSITRLNLSSNHFGALGADRLRKALEKNVSIQYLDLSRNALGFQSINSIICSCAPKKITIKTNGNFVLEEILNSVSHGLAFIFAIIGANLLMAEASAEKYSDYHFWSCALYSFALLFLFLSSCLFHSFFMMPATSRILQILDHVGIYMVIAGTFTPFMLITLHHNISARTLLIMEWIVAVAGATFAGISDLNAPTTSTIELSLFLMMAFGVVFVYSYLHAALPSEALVILVLGGGSYLAGIPFFLLGEVNPAYHVIWHLFVMLAAALHWFAVYFFVLETKIIGVDLNNVTSVQNALMDYVGIQ